MTLLSSQIHCNPSGGESDLSTIHMQTTHWDMLAVHGHSHTGPCEAGLFSQVVRFPEHCREDGAFEKTIDRRRPSLRSQPRERSNSAARPSTGTVQHKSIARHGLDPLKVVSQSIGFLAKHMWTFLSEGVCPFLTSPTTTNRKPQTTKPQTTNHETTTPRTTNHKPQNHEPQTTNHKPQTTNHKPQTTNHSNTTTQQHNKITTHTTTQQRNNNQHTTHNTQEWAWCGCLDSMVTG